MTDVLDRLSQWLPPFASDYSGAASALYGMGGITIMCDAGCCTDHYVFHDEPRWTQGYSDVCSVTLRTVDTVLGCDGDIVSRCCDFVRLRKAPPAFIALIGTPVPALVGMDMCGIACEIEDELGIPAFGLDMSGFRHYDHGIVEACKELVTRFSSEPVRAGDSEALSVNILGVTPLDYAEPNSLQAMTCALKSRGVDVIACLPGAQGVDEVARIGQADVNLAVSAAGLRIAKFLEATFGTPHVCACPVETEGDRLLDEIVDSLERAARTGSSAVPHSILGRRTGGPAKTLIIGDQVMAQSVAVQRAEKLSPASAVIASPFSWDPNLAASQDFAFKSEHELISKIAELQPHTVVADPLYELLVSRACALPEVQFVPFVHPAVSGSALRGAC